MQQSRSLLRATRYRTFSQRLRLPAAAQHAFLRSFPPEYDLRSTSIAPNSSLSSGSGNFANRISTHSVLAERGVSRHSALQRRTFLGLGRDDGGFGLSKQHEETRIVGYSPEQLFAVAADVDSYQDFVPWCQRSTILWRQNDTLEADLEIGFKYFVERYISHVELIRPSLIKVSVSRSSLFDYLTNTWEFKPGPSLGTSNLHFSVKFQFKSLFYQQAANMFFQEVVSCIIGSFEDRCRRLYGPATKTLGKTVVA